MNEQDEQQDQQAQQGEGEQVLTDDEKNALLDGVASGQVEVQSADGVQYAAVRPYVVGRRARIRSKSLPRLENINRLFAKQLAANCSNLLQTELDITAGAIRTQPFGDFCESWPGRSVAMSFSATPLSGKGLIVVDSILIAPLVETFFGGNSPESVAHNDAAHSRGSLSIVQLLFVETLGILCDAWAPLAALAPERDELKIGLERIDAIAAADSVIVSEFEMTLGEDGEERGSFCIIWQESSLAPLRAALAGQDRDQDPAEAARWEKILRKRLPEVVVGLSSTVGHVRMTLGDIMRLQPGDVIGIDTPRVATVIAHGIPLLEGRFGVQAGRNAIETVTWLEPSPGN